MMESLMLDTSCSHCEEAGCWMRDAKCWMVDAASELMAGPDSGYPVLRALDYFGKKNINSEVSRMRTNFSRRVLKVFDIFNAFTKSEAR
jgi:hypothetical protein